MSFSTVDTEIQYTGNNVDSTFEIPFFYTDANSIKVEKYDMAVDEPVAELLTLNVDYRHVGSQIELVVITPDPVTGEPVDTPVPLQTSERLRIFRDTIDYHQINYNGYQFPAPVVNTDFDRVYQRLQELRREVDRAIKLNALSLEDGDTLTGEEILEAMAELKALIEGLDSGTGLPAGGLDGDYIQRKIDEETGAITGEWKSGSYEGYSARFGQMFSSTSLDDTLLKILDFAYTAAGITLSSTPSSAVREKGVAVPSVTLTAVTTKRSNDIATVEFYRGGSLIFTEAAPSASGGSVQHTSNTPFSDTMSFYARVYDGQSWTNSNTITYSYVYPYYHGAGAPALTAAQVAGLTKSVIASSSNLNRTFTTANGNVYYFAYPSGYGALSSILDENGFETIGDWTLRSETITGLDGTAQTYRIYEFKNPVVAGTTNYTFKR